MTQSGKSNDNKGAIWTPSQLHISPKGRTKHSHTHWTYTQSRVFMYCRQTEALSAEVTERLLGPLSKIQRMCMCDCVCVCVFHCMCVLADRKWGSQLAGVKSGPGCSSCVRHTPTNPFTHRQKNHTYTFPLVRQSVMLPISTGLEFLILCRWNKNKYGTNSTRQMGEIILCNGF